MRKRIALVLILHAMSSWNFQELAAQELSDDHSAPLPNEHQRAIADQSDFFDRHNPSDLVRSNRTAREEIRMSPHQDVSMFSDELIETADIPIMQSAHRYTDKEPEIDVSRLLPSNVGPTGLIDSISGRGLKRGQYSAGYLHTEAQNKFAGVFLNVRNYDSTDSTALVNYGLSDNVELNMKFLHTDRSVESGIGTIFDSSQVQYPEYAYGLKLHQNWRGKDFGFGFMNANINARARNMILDQDFEYYKSLYFTVTSDLTYRTESHITIKRNTLDNKYLANNSWYSLVGGVDTKLSKDTHLMVEGKFEDYVSPTRKWSLNGGIRQMFGNTGVEAYGRRLNQPGFSEVGFKISGTF